MTTSTVHGRTLDRHFPEFVALLFPAIHAAIDWTRGHMFLDKEFQQAGRDAELGRRNADKLVRVSTRQGAETWVLIQVKVQGEPERSFAEWMYVYHDRLTGIYRRVAGVRGGNEDTLHGQYGANRVRFAAIKWPDLVGSMQRLWSSDLILFDKVA